MVIKKTAIWLYRVLWTCVVAVVVAVAAYVSLGRYYVDHIGYYTPEIFHAIYQRTGLEMDATTLSGRWSKLAPVITVSGFKLYNPENPDDIVVAAAQLELKIDVLESLLERTLNIGKLNVSDLFLQVEEVELGRWRLKDLPRRGGDVDVDVLIDTLLAVDYARIDAAEMLVFFTEGQRTTLHGNSIALQRRGAFRRAQVQLTIADNPAPLSLLVESRGDPRNPRQFSADAFVEFEGVDFTPVLPATHFSGMAPGQAFIDGRLWFSWQGGMAVDSRGELTIPYIDMAGLTNTDIKPFTDLTLKFLAQGKMDHWQAWIHSFNADWAGRAINFDRMLVEGDFRQAQQLTVALPELAVSPLVAWLLDSALIEKDFTLNALETLEPDGLLRNVHLTLPVSENADHRFLMRAQLQDVQVAPWRGAPGARHVNGYVQAGLKNGFVSLATNNLALRFPKIYAHELSFERALAQVQWSITDEAVYVNSGPIRLWANDGDGPAVGLLALDLPHDKTLRDRSMTLMIGLTESAASYRDKYLPKVLSDDLSAWLKRAIKDGDVSQGAFVYRGSVMPGDRADRTVQLYFDVDDAALDYHDSWPALRDIEARLWIDDGRVDVVSPRARAMDHTRLHDVAVTVQPQDGGGSWLRVNGGVQTRDGDVLRLLRETAIRDTVGDAFDHWQWQGAVDATLALGVPIGIDGRQPHIDVATRLRGGTLTIDDYRLQFTDVRGPLHYSDQRGLTATGLTGQWYDNTLAVDVTQRDAAVEVAINGAVEMATLEHWLREPALVFAEGSSDIEMAIRIDREAGSYLRARSDLVGVTIDLPAPFAKPAEQSLALQLSMPIGGDEQVLALDLGEHFSLGARFREREFDGGSLRLGDARQAPPITSGRLSVGGQVTGLAVEPWWAALEQYLAAAKQRSGGGGEGDVTVQLSDLQLEQVDAYGHTIEQLRLSGQQQTDRWLFDGRSERFAGRLTLYTQGDQPPVLALSSLVLPERASEDERDDALSGLLADVDPAQLIDIDVSIAELRVGERQLGHVAFAMRTHERGLQLNNLTGQLNGLRLQSDENRATDFYWWRGPGGDRSQFVGHVTFADFGNVLKAFNYENIVESEEGYADINMSWPGPPDALRLQTLRGDVHFSLHDGRFLNTSSTATGALKVVGIFNFANLLRRLQFDFSDIYKSGLSYDDVAGSIRFQNGELQLSEPLIIQGPSSRFTLTGEVDIVDEDTRLDLVATLPIGTNLPWIAAIAGGLPAAAGVYVASKIFEETVDKFSSAVYEIRGPWSDPEIRFNKIFDDTATTNESSGPVNIHDRE